MKNLGTSQNTRQTFFTFLR